MGDCDNLLQSPSLGADKPTEVTDSKVARPEGKDGRRGSPMAEGTPRSLGPDVRIGVLFMLLGAASAACYAAWLRHWGPSLGQGRFPVVALAAGFAVFEIFVVHLEYRREVH